MERALYNWSDVLDMLGYRIDYVAHTEREWDQIKAQLIEQGLRVSYPLGPDQPRIFPRHFDNFVDRMYGQDAHSDEGGAWTLNTGTPIQGTTPTEEEPEVAPGPYRITMTCRQTGQTFDSETAVEEFIQSYSFPSQRLAPPIVGEPGPEIITPTPAAAPPPPSIALTQDMICDEVVEKILRETIAGEHRFEERRIGDPPREVPPRESLFCRNLIAAAKDRNLLTWQEWVALDALMAAPTEEG